MKIITVKDGKIIEVAPKKTKIYRSKSTGNERCSNKECTSCYKDGKKK